MNLETMTDQQLKDAHERLHGDILDTAIVTAHHRVTGEMTVRGLNHEHTEDEWSRTVIETASDTVWFDNGSHEDTSEYFDDDTLGQISKELGGARVAQRVTLLSVDGEMYRFDLLDPMIKMIRQEADKWVVYSHDGTRKFGSYDTENEAKQRLAQIEQFKAMGKSEDFNPEIEYLESLDEMDKLFFRDISRALDAGVEPFEALAKAGNPDALRRYWAAGGDGKVEWGPHGDFNQCVAAVGKYMDTEQAKGYCALRHREATGMWPAQQAKKSVDWINMTGTSTSWTGGNGLVTINLNSDSIQKHLMGQHDQKMHGNRAGGNEMTADDFDQIRTNLHQREVKLSYAEAYEKGQQDAESHPEWFTPDRIERKKQRLGEALQRFRSTVEDSPEATAYAEEALRQQGHLDGATGTKRKIANTWFGGSNRLVGAFYSGEAFAPFFNKHLAGQHDQQTHGNRGGESLVVSKYPSREDGQRFGAGDNVPLSDKEFNAMKAKSGAEHLLGRRPDGTPIFTPERQALHDRLVAEAVSGVRPTADKVYYVLGGGSGTGKTTLVKSGKTDIPLPDTKKAVLIDADSLKEQLPEFRQKALENDFTGSNAHDAEIAADFVHEESSYIAKRINAAAFQRNQSVVLDGTGNSDKDSIAKKLKHAADDGYRITAVYATVSTPEAIRRNNERFDKLVEVRRKFLAGEEGGRDVVPRKVPSHILAATHQGVSNVFPEVVKMMRDTDKISLFDVSDGTKPKLLISGSGGTMQLHDDTGYAAFLEKGD